MTLSRGAEWEATDRRETEGSRNLRRSSRTSQVEKSQVTPGSQGLLHLEPKMSMDSIAPTLVVKTPEISEHSDATPPAKHRNAKGRVLRAASSLAPDKGSLDEESHDNHDNQSQISRPPKDQDKIVPSPHHPADGIGPAGKRKRVLRAASDLAPGSCVDTESLRSPIASFDGASQQGDICMKEPPVADAIENQKSRDNIAADMTPSGTADRPAMERQKLSKPWVDQAETQCWFGSDDCLPQPQQALEAPQRRSNSTAETELEASQASQSQEAGASQQRDTQDAVDAQMAQEQQVPADEPSEPSGEPASEPAGESLVDQRLGGQADAISPALHPPARKSHLKHRLVGKQTVRHGSSQRPAYCLRSGSNVSRARIGHTLDPPERGFLVRVQGDGWGGSGGSYLATVTESDAETFTVIRRGDCYGSWDETHVLKTCCSIVARTTSKEHVFLSANKGREGRTSRR